MDFRKLCIDDREIFCNILKNNDEFSSEYAFGTSFIWSETYNIEFSIHKNTIFKRFKGKYDAYSFPYGNMDIREAIKFLFDNCKYNGGKLKIIGLTQEKKEILENLFPDKFCFKEERDSWDYLYKRVDLAELKGRKYHQKRNHISKFNKIYDWHYEKINAKNIDMCREISDKWFSESNNKDILNEKGALEKAIEFYKELDFFGGIIKVGDNPVAFTMGEKVNEKVFLVHFEKAKSEIEGAYSVINNEFCRRLEGYDYINREEDMGLEGLRKSKMSYKPLFLVKKYTAIAGED